jgi:hypothetical protein
MRASCCQYARGLESETTIGPGNQSGGSGQLRDTVFSPFRNGSAHSVAHIAVEFPVSNHDPVLWAIATQPAPTPVELPSGL